jgi:hypothetical protein
VAPARAGEPLYLMLMARETAVALASRLLERVGNDAGDDDGRRTEIHRDAHAARRQSADGDRAGKHNAKVDQMRKIRIVPRAQPVGTHPVSCQARCRLWPTRCCATSMPVPSSTTAK